MIHLKINNIDLMILYWAYTVTLHVKFMEILSLYSVFTCHVDS